MDNVVGAGEGCCLEFKRKYPEMYRRYRELYLGRLQIAFFSVSNEHQEQGAKAAIPAAKRFNLFKLLQITKNSLRRKL